MVSLLLRNGADAAMLNSSQQRAIDVASDDQVIHLLSQRIGCKYLSDDVKASTHDVHSCSYDPMPDATAAAVMSAEYPELVVQHACRNVVVMKPACEDRLVNVETCDDSKPLDLSTRNGIRYMHRSCDINTACSVTGRFADKPIRGQVKSWS